jgi:hypothetical protein
MGTKTSYGRQLKYSNTNVGNKLDFKNLLYIYTDGIITLSIITPLYYTESGAEPLNMMPKTYD